jgi:phosphatidylglycerol lysyltransferase
MANREKETSPPERRLSDVRPRHHAAQTRVPRSATHYLPRYVLRYAGPTIGLALFLFALWILRQQLADHRFREVMRYADTMPRHRIGLAIVATLVSFVVLSGYDVLALRYVRKRLSYPRVALASFLNYAFAQGLGFPLLTGGSVRYRMYSQWGLSTVEITRLVAFTSLTFWLGALTMVGIVAVAMPTEIERALPIGAGPTRALGLALLIVVLLYVWWTIVGKRVVRVGSWGFRTPRVSLALLQLIQACVDWGAAATVLYVLMPAELGISYVTFVGMFVVAFVAGVVSHVPGGLGVFESVMIVLLPETVSEGAVLGALIVYRAVYYLLPLVTAAATLGVLELLPRRTRIVLAAGAVQRAVRGIVPSVLAFTTFLGGMILLVSGATPAAQGRLRWVNHFLPLPIIEASHFLASLAGIGLVLLASGLQRRLDGAYHLSVGLLVAGVVFSLLKGLDYEEATALAIMLAALVPARREFFRKSSLLAESFTPGWIAAVVLAVVTTAWVGVFAYRNLDLTSDIWWRFAWSADAPRFARAMVGVSGAVLFVAIGRLMRPASLPPELPSRADLDDAERVVRRSADSWAFAALVGDKHLLFNDARRSFIMYAVEGRSWVALGDPVGPAEDHVDLVWKYRELADRNGGWTVFYLVSKANLNLYVDLGLSLLKVGEEAHVSLRDFTLEGGQRKSLRQTHQKAIREGTTFELLQPPHATTLLAELRTISDAWLDEKNTREKGFSLGRFDESYLSRLPVAVARQGGRLVGFANVWAAGGVELSVDLMRFVPSSPPGIMDYLFVELILWGKANGYETFNFGMAPLAGLENRRLAPMWYKIGSLVFRLGEHFYNFRGVRRYKDKFNPVWHPRYIASPGGILLPRMIANIATLVSGGARGVIGK